METAIRWSPSSTTAESRFLLVDVSGRIFRHCVVTKYDGHDLEYETLSTSRTVPAFRAFDWSPHDESIVAVGAWSGEVSVLRIDDSPQVLSLPIRHQRNCNAVAFNTTGLVATGLERVRSDYCLNVWDLNSPPLTVSSPTAGSAKASYEPSRKFASSEPITSIKFYPTQPDTFIAGVKSTCIRIYDLRDGSGNGYYQFQTPYVHNIAIDPLDENYFACAGPPKDTTIQVWDRRMGLHSSATALSSGFGQPAWQSPLLEFRNCFDDANEPNVWSLKWCRGKSGCLAALASNGHFRAIEFKKQYLPETERSAQNSESAIEDISVPRLFTKRRHQIECSYDHPSKGRLEADRVVSFDFTNLAGSCGRPCVITLRGNRTVEIHELKDYSSALALSPKSALAMSKVNSPNMDGSLSSGEFFLDNRVHAVQPREKGSIAHSINLLRSVNPKISRSGKEPQYIPVDPTHGTRTDGNSTTLRLSSREAHEGLYEVPRGGQMLSLENALTQFTVSRRRSAEGYLFDDKKNALVLLDDRWLQDMWDWIGHAKSNAQDEGMVAEAIDLSFLGVYNIWKGDLGPHAENRHLARKSSSSDANPGIEALSKRLNLPELALKTTAFPNNRQLCLHICGFGLRYEELEKEVKHLVLQGQNTHAAALAMIHDQAKLAFQALRNGTASATHREISLALAGFVKGSTDDIWDETVREIAKSSDDPYARAILALVSYGDWHDVLLETSLPLRDRIGVALMYLDDEELTQYIEETTSECVEQGDIEGIILTGLGEKAVPLFENYIIKFADLQTAVLAMALTTPRYFTDLRVGLWRDTYRSHLNAWRMFIPRVHFDVQCTKLSTLPGQRPLLPPPPRQITLRCNHCDQALDRNPDHASAPARTPAPATSFGTHQGSIFGDIKSGSVCPKCGRHMPRCVICMMWLGTPDPHTRGGAAAAAAAEKDPMSKFISMCRSCWHMSHGGHAQEWFAEHDVCPVPECECRCVEIDAGARF